MTFTHTITRNLPDGWDMVISYRDHSKPFTLRFNGIDVAKGYEWPDVSHIDKAGARHWWRLGYIIATDHEAKIQAVFDAFVKAEDARHEREVAATAASAQAREDAARAAANAAFTDTPHPPAE